MILGHIHIKHSFFFFFLNPLEADTSSPCWDALVFFVEELKSCKYESQVQIKQGMQPGTSGLELQLTIIFKVDYFLE